MLTPVEAEERLVSIIGGRIVVSSTVWEAEDFSEPRVVMEPRWRLASNVAGGAKSSASTPFAIWRDPRREVGVLWIDWGPAKGSAGKPKVAVQSGAEAEGDDVRGSDLVDSAMDCLGRAGDLIARMLIPSGATFSSSSSSARVCFSKSV